MTPLEYVEVLAVEQALYETRKQVRCLSNLGYRMHHFDDEGRANYLLDKHNWKRYIRCPATQLGYLGVDGVVLAT